MVECLTRQCLIFNYFCPQLFRQEAQWDLKFGLFWILNGWKEVGLQMVRIWNTIWNPEAQPLSEIRKPNPLKSGQIAAILSKNHLKSGQKCQGFKWLGLSSQLKPDHLKTGPIEIRPLKSPDFKCFRISDGWISGPHFSLKCLYVTGSVTMAGWFTKFWLDIDLTFSLGITAQN